MTIFDWIGVLGSLMLAGAYLMVSLGKVSAERPAFQLLNLCGSLLILLSLYFRPNAGAIIIEVAWAVIAMIALIRWFRTRK